LSGNPFLLKIHKELGELVQLLTATLYFGKTFEIAEGITHHTLIIDALRRGEVATAVEIATEHLKRFYSIEPTTSD
jgi:DNA-binding GntR family transcriptional regulator